jgi:hypothetical protein
MGLLFVPSTILAIAGVPSHETGAASGLLNVALVVVRAPTPQQVPAGSS